MIDSPANTAGCVARCMAIAQFYFLGSEIARPIDLFLVDYLIRPTIFLQSSTVACMRYTCMQGFHLFLILHCHYIVMYMSWLDFLFFWNSYALSNLQNRPSYRSSIGKELGKAFFFGKSKTKSLK